MGALSQQPRAETSFRVHLGEWRTFADRALTLMAIGLGVCALLPLFSVLYMLVVRGSPLLSLGLFSELTPGAGMDSGGIGNAILGTVVVVTLAATLSLPLGLFAAIYLAEYGAGSRLSVVVRFAGKVLSGMPSILAGVFAYAIAVSALGSFSAFAGGVALAILIVPTVMLTAEEALRLVPYKMKQAALGMGATRAQMVTKVLIPTAAPGILTGVMLALSRAAGETAPLLLTALFSDYWFDGKLDQPIASLAVLIYNFSGSPFEHQVNLAWAGSLVLVVLVLLFNILAQAVTRRPEEH